MNIRIGRKAATPEPCGHVSVIKPAVTPADRECVAAALAEVRKTDPNAAIADFLSYRLEAGDVILRGGAR